MKDKILQGLVVLGIVSAIVGCTARMIYQNRHESMEYQGWTLVSRSSQTTVYYRDIGPDRMYWIDGEVRVVRR